jgi:hypothetical protein
MLSPFVRPNSRGICFDFVLKVQRSNADPAKDNFDHCA